MSASILPGCPSSLGQSIPWETLRKISVLADLAGCPQNPAYHAEGDVLEHTRLVAEELVKMPAWLALPKPEQEILYAAALLHDIGKPATLLPVSPDNPVAGQAPGHARKGAYMTRRLLWERAVPFAAREAVVALVRSHMRPRFVAELPDPRPELYRLSWLTRLDHLALLAEADARGRLANSLSEDLDRLAYFRDYAQTLGCLSAPRPFGSDLARVEFFANPSQDPDYTPYDNTWGQVTLLAGLPGSGKDRWLAQSGLHQPVLSLDEYRLAHPRLPSSEIAQMAHNEAKKLLAAKTPFIWNATNLVRELRGGLINLCRRYHASVKIIYLEVPEVQLRAQNASRPCQQVVPDQALDKILSRWDIPDLTETHQLQTIVTAQPHRRLGGLDV